MLLQRARSYALQSREILRESPTARNFADLLWFFPGWYNSLDGRRAPLTDEQPWLTYASIRRLDRVLATRGPREGDGGDVRLAVDDDVDAGRHGRNARRDERGLLGEERRGCQHSQDRPAYDCVV